MLPNRMQLSKSTEEQLKKLKAQTGITPNISARIAFFKSFENGFNYDSSEEYRNDGTLVLDKITWLGRTQILSEKILKFYYPNFTERQLHTAWAFHVEKGMTSFRTAKTVKDLLSQITR